MQNDVIGYICHFRQDFLIPPLLNWVVRFGLLVTHHTHFDGRIHRLHLFNEDSAMLPVFLGADAAATWYIVAGLPWPPIFIANLPKLDA